MPSLADGRLHESSGWAELGLSMWRRNRSWHCHETDDPSASERVEVPVSLIRRSPQVGKFTVRCQALVPDCQRRGLGNAEWEANTKSLLR